MHQFYTWFIIGPNQSTIFIRITGVGRASRRLTVLVREPIPFRNGHDDNLRDQILHLGYVLRVSRSSSVSDLRTFLLLLVRGSTGRHCPALTVSYPLNMSLNIQFLRKGQSTCDGQETGRCCFSLRSNSTVSQNSESGHLWPYLPGNSPPRALYNPTVVGGQKRQGFVPPTRIPSILHSPSSK